MKSNKSLHIRLARREQISGFARFLCMTRQGLYKALKTGKKNLWIEYIKFIGKEIYMLGKKVYYLDLKEGGNVYEAIVAGEIIGQTGYRSYRLKTETGFTYREKPYVYPDKESAKAAFDIFYPKAQEMRRIQAEATAKIDAIRAEILGKPEFNGEEYYGKDAEEDA
jgi:hypothetical protein